MEIRFTKGALPRASVDAELPLSVVRAPDLSGRVLGQRYSLRRRIGGGSMGTVYEARDMTLGTAVAVKVLHPDYCGDEDFRRRFHQEALLGARLRHEHSVAVTDLGQSDDGLLYSVMEYLEGESLDALLEARPGPLPWRRVVTIAVQVCAALQAAHDRGVIHRDIKPGNCFLVRRESNNPLDPLERLELDQGPPFTFVKVLDLGLARLIPSTGRPTPPGRLGAPEYLAPEQIQGFTCDHRVDIYALGVLMYKLLTRRLPFTGDNPAAIMRMHIETPPAPLRRAAGSEIPVSLEAVVLRALSKDRAHRYPSAHAMAQAIRSAAADAEAETIAIHEADAEPSGLWRLGMLPTRPASQTSPASASQTSPASASQTSPASASQASQASATMILVPAFGRGPDLRHGLLILLAALAGILLAVIMPGGPREAWHHPDDGPIVTTSADPLAASPAGPLPTGPEPPRAVRLPEPAPLLAVDLLGVNAEPPPPTPTPRKRRLTPAPALTPEPATARTPGTPPEATFHRLIDTVVPGLHRCMRSQTPPVPRLQLALTVGGPRHNGVAMHLGEHQANTDLVACIGRLVHRLHFPASEHPARYSHPVKLP